MLFFNNYSAGVAELVDALDLGSSDFCRVGSSPSARTKEIKMKIDEKKNNGLDLEWNVTIPSSLINPRLEEKYSNLGKNLKIPGFRQGKVPINIIKKRFSQSVISETLDTIINDNLRKVFFEKKIKPSVQPSVNIEKYEEGEDLILKVIIQKMPDVKDFDLKSISLEKSTLNIREEDINNTLNDIAKKHERFSPLKKNRPAINGDLVLFDYEGKINIFLDMRSKC